MYYIMLCFYKKIIRKYIEIEKIYCYNSFIDRNSGKWKDILEKINITENLDMKFLGVKSYLILLRKYGYKRNSNMVNHITSK